MMSFGRMRDRVMIRGEKIVFGADLEYKGRIVDAFTQSPQGLSLLFIHLERLVAPLSAGAACFAGTLRRLLQLPFPEQTIATETIRHQHAV
jgi:hypothetical protein